MVQTDADRGDGWFRSGDVGVLNDSYHLVLNGRADDLINRGGVKVSPEVIESILRSHPLISDAAIAVMPVGDVQRGLVGFVVARDKVSFDAIRDHLSSRNKDIVIDKWVFVESIPKTDTGKIDRPSLINLKNQ
jgi:acyl-coenzyme A synthetase/AMP-(fatty) acid ligase